jgi:hypothetical protein
MDCGKAKRNKLRFDDKAHGPLYWLESLEAIGLGIDGKAALWRALNTAAMGNPALDGILDYRRLEKRAQEQREAVERVRLDAARAALQEDRAHFTEAPMTGAQSVANPNVPGSV